MKLSWRVLGFDVREGKSDCLESPLPQRMRDQFLLRPEIACPFSVDYHIWPSLFLFHSQMRMIHASAQGLVPAILADGLGLWTNLEFMHLTLFASQAEWNTDLSGIARTTKYDCQRISFKLDFFSETGARPYSRRQRDARLRCGRRRFLERSVQLRIHAIGTGTTPARVVNADQRLWTTPVGK